MADKFAETGLIPVSGLEAWHRLEVGISGNDVIYDSSGNSRGVTAPDTPPALQSNVLNKQLGMYWDGTKKPLSYSGTFNARHIFTVAAFDGAAFADAEGLLTDLTQWNIFVGAGAATTKFFVLDPSLEPYDYKKNGTAFAAADMQAPMGLQNAALLEMKFDNAESLNGIRFGQDRANTSRKWKGWLFESLIYSGSLSETDINRIYLYLNLKFGLWEKGLPLRFPDAALLYAAGVIPAPAYSFYDDNPPDFGDITDTITFDDNSKDFNEFADPDNAARFWDLEINLVRRTAEETRALTVIFDEFWRQARLSNPFTFVDKQGETHENVRIFSYNRAHEGHKSWRKNIKFRLVKYPE